MVTGASLRTDKKAFVLLSYGKIYFFNIVDDGKIFAEPALCKRFNRAGQTEGITYLNESDLLISNEAGNLFLLSKKR